MAAADFSLELQIGLCPQCNSSFPIGTPSVRSAPTPAATTSLLSGGGEAIVMMLFPLIHVVIGVGVTYTLVAMMVNRSTLSLTQSHLAVSHGPLPWGSPDPIALSSIDQLYVVKRVQKNHKTFSLVARRRDLTSIELLSGLPNDIQARYLERRIEAHLGLADIAVAHEYTG